MRPSDSNRALTAHLSRLLEGQGLSRMALSKRIGVADGTLGRIKYGTGNPTIDVIDKIARYFRVKPWELLQPLDGSAAISADAVPALAPGLHEEIAALDSRQQRALLALIQSLRDE